MAEDTEAPDLSIVTSKQLIDELRTRAAAFVIGFDPEGNREQAFYTCSAGDVLGCAGMVRKLQMMCDDALERGECDDDDETGEE
jgi:hypothetical protein